MYDSEIEREKTEGLNPKFIEIFKELKTSKIVMDQAMNLSI